MTGRRKVVTKRAAVLDAPEPPPMPVDGSACREMVTLIPAADEQDQRRRDDCAAADHPPENGCFNPWFGQTFCPCGAARYPGKQRVLPEPVEVLDRHLPLRERVSAAGAPHTASVPVQVGLFPIPEAS